MSNIKNLPQSIVSIKVYSQYALDIEKHVGTKADEITYCGDHATISWNANGGVEEWELEQKVRATGAGEPKVTELS
tara:strand:+ start:748 stop:975 length:228 start_codon:yes stop_codon:yes gene_type:complete